MLSNTSFVLYVFAATIAMLVLMAVNTPINKTVRESGIFPDMLDTVYQLFDEENFLGAEAMLLQVLAEEDLSRSARLRSLRLLAACQMRRNALQEAQLTLGRLEMEVIADGDKLDLLIVLSDKSELFIRMDNDLEAIKTALEALSLGEDLKEDNDFRSRVLAPIHYNLAMLHARRDELYMSRAFLLSAISIWAENARTAKEENYLLNAHRLLLSVNFAIEENEDIEN
jgi:hypothetical protein